MKKHIFLFLLFATPLWGQNTIALEYSSEVPFIMASKNSIEVFEKQLFASKLANDIIGVLLTKVEQDPTPRDHYYTVLIRHPMQKGTTHLVEGVIKKEALKNLLVSEAKFYDTLQLIYNDTSDWVLRYL